MLTAILVSACQALQNGAEAQHPVAQITADRPRLHHVEPFIIVRPGDPRRMLVVATEVHDLSRSDRGGWITTALYSRDAGATWRRSPLPRRDGVACFGDPWAYWFRGDTVFVVCMANVPAPDASTYETFLFRSPDGGATWDRSWTVPTARAGHWDHPVVVGGGGDNDSVIAVVGQLAGRQGSFVNAAPFDLRRQEFRAPLAFVPPAMRNTASAVVVPPDTIIGTYYPLDARPWFFRTFLAAADSAQHLSQIAEDITPWGYPAFVRDGAASSPRRGAIYAAWVQGRAASGLQVLTARSDDSGRSWGPSSAVADNPVAFRALPAMAIDSNGLLLLVWHDRRDDPRDRCGIIMVRASADGGLHWGLEERVTGTSYCNQTTPANVGERFYGGTDYSSAVALEPGRFAIVFAKAIDGVMQLYLATLSVRP
jgi:hypothetical protein